MQRISHNINDESIEAKVLWFRTLPISERMEMLCNFTDLALDLNPDLAEKKMLNRLKDVFASFQKHEVKYIVIGGIASVLYGVPRATFDLDILIEATPENTQQLLDALLEAGLSTASLTNIEEILSLKKMMHNICVRRTVQLPMAALSIFSEAMAQ